MSSSANSRGMNVLARAYGDEPVRCQIVSEDIDSVEVIVKERGGSIRLPRRSIFLVSEETATALFAAFAGGGEQELEMLWHMARSTQGDSSCTRYQDLIGSGHGKEDPEIGDPGAASAGRSE